jgi:iron-sulfur cluster repair protein YtfE (RIC family)
VCSYCGCRAIAPVARLSAEHVEVLELLGDLRRAPALGRAGFDEALDRLTQALGAHTGGEERSLLAELRDDPELGAHVAALCAEHGEIDEALAALRPGDAPALAALETLLRRHIDKEENGLFPAAAIALGAEAWDRVDVLLRADPALVETLRRWEDSGGTWRPTAEDGAVVLVSCTGEEMETLRSAIPSA